MKVLLAGALALAAASLTGPAAAEPAQEAASAMRACLDAVIEGAPVDSIRAGEIEITRERDPNACTVAVSEGEPAVVREAVLKAVADRRERFTPAKTRWDPGQFATRETWCNVAGRRHLNVVISTGMPGRPLKLIATALEAKERDSRCDRDEGVQKPPLAPAAAPAASQ
ncbi:hypothetical protein [Phenylobacterium sp.]|uniref:hypothetical protein n=1 Tax=Phenylobacterium sp. TaxID=1871053 RepID=UPI0035B00AC2